MKASQVTLLALFIGFMVVGAQIHLMPMVTFDAFPAYLAALVFGPRIGAALAALGHFVAAGVMGFPMTLPAHIVIMIIMAVTVYVYGFIAKDGQSLMRVALGSLAAYIINVPMAIMGFATAMGKAVWLVALPLTAGAVANLVLAYVLYRALQAVWGTRLRAMRKDMKSKSVKTVKLGDS